MENCFCLWIGSNFTRLGSRKYYYCLHHASWLFPPKSPCADILQAERKGVCLSTTMEHHPEATPQEVQSNISFPFKRPISNQTMRSLLSQIPRGRWWKKVKKAGKLFLLTVSKCGLKHGRHCLSPTALLCSCDGKLWKCILSSLTKRKHPFYHSYETFSQTS